MSDDKKPGIKAGRPAFPATRQVNMDRASYLKALGHEHPRNSFVPVHQVMNRVVRITARLLNNDKNFIDAIKNQSGKTIGQVFHSKAKHVLRAMVKHGKVPKGLAGHAERAIRTGKGGSIGDAFFRNKGNGKPVAEFDHKLSVDAALKGKDQLKRHAEDFADPTNPKNKGSVAAAPRIQQALIIKQAVLAHAKNAAKALMQRFGGAGTPATSPAKPSSQSLSVKSSAKPGSPGATTPAKPGSQSTPAKPNASPGSPGAKASAKLSSSAATPAPTAKPAGAAPSPTQLRGSPGRASPAKPTSGSARVSPPTASQQTSVNSGKNASTNSSSSSTPNA
jgi:hypothetical protein